MGRFFSPTFILYKSKFLATILWVINMPRIKRQQSCTNIYHVMARGNNKSKIFLDEEDKNNYLKIIGTKKENLNFLLYSYALMDNHIHLVINENNSIISEIMK